MASQSVDLSNLFVREIERNDGTEIKISQSSVGDVGCVVWDAAIVLTKFLETPFFRSLYGTNDQDLGGKRVVELGSGTGVVGIQAACLGGTSFITDLPEFVPLMKLNIENNKHLTKAPVTAQALRWGDTPDSALLQPDIILIADCIYYEESLGPLVSTIRELSGGNTTVLCCYEERTTGNKPRLQKQFFEMVEKSFHVEEIPLEEQDALFRSEDIHIMKFVKR